MGACLRQNCPNEGEWLPAHLHRAAPLPARLGSFVRPAGGRFLLLLMLLLLFLFSISLSWPQTCNGQPASQPASQPIRSLELRLERERARLKFARLARLDRLPVGLQSRIKLRGRPGPGAACRRIRVVIGQIFAQLAGDLFTYGPGGGGGGSSIATIAPI